jgi:hypothetical protein
MQRLVPVLLAVLFMIPAVAAAQDPVFGGGAVAFQEYEVLGASKVGEPTIGIPWNTDDVFFHSGSKTMRGTFNGNEVDWVDVTPVYQAPTNLDPLLVADEDSGRILAGGLAGPCSVMMISDDNGETWIPGGNICSGAQFDHQSLGIGPKPVLGNAENLPQLQNAYYCGQLILIGCSVSFDGGETWTAPSPVAPAYANNGCGGFHGHWRISRVTGTAFLPVPGCDVMGMIIPDVLGQDGTQVGGATGITWDARTIPGSHQWDGGFDPSIGIGREEGWLYYGMADHMGARMGVTKDEGVNWGALPDGQGGVTTWLDVGQFHDPPIVAAQFADVQAGDDDRAAFTFLGLLDLDGEPGYAEYGSSNRVLYDCDPETVDAEGNPVELRAWHYFAAFTFDGGRNWTVDQLTDHPVQMGGVWDGGGGNPCRNLLDFNDMDIDSLGRVHIGYADGCIEDCLAEDGARYSREPRILRQTGGKGLFEAYDVLVDPSDALPNIPANTPENDVPGIPAMALLVMLGALAVLRRRTQ